MVALSSLDVLSQLVLPSLEELHLSLMVDGAADREKTVPDKWHACQCFNELLISLANLKEVHPTLSCVCAHVFDIDTLSDPLSLAVMHVKAGTLRERESQLARCGEVALDGTVESSAQHEGNSLAEDLARAAKVFASSVQSLEILRIQWLNEFSRSLAATVALNGFSGELLTSEYYDTISALGRDTPYYLYIWDCLADEVRTLPHWMPWDSAGTVVDLQKDTARWEGKWNSAREDGQIAYTVIDLG